ncbi:hypothetical protein EPO33_04480 [Patescibacteria group bacterium]|nr:MAG: hypothetical protein EPO33_04480 [Patescibacteria group bacterium]
MKSDSQKLDQLILTVVEMREYMHTELATKQEVCELRQEMLTNFDQQGVMLQRLDHEFVALRGNSDRRLTRVEKHLGFSDI